MPSRFLLAAVAALLLAALAPAQKLQLDLASPALVEQRLAAGVVSTKVRQETIRSLFSEAGCATEDQPLDRHAGNVICRLPGETDSTIAVGGHYDFIDRGAGIIDDWSGVSLLPSLYQALKKEPRHHTYVFLAFAKEEQGLVGSTHYVSRLTNAQKSRVHAFLNLECLGLTPPKVWMHRATPALVRHLLAVGQSLGLPVQGVNVEKVGDDDSHPFLNAGIPVLTLHSVNQDNIAMLHSGFDRLEAIHQDDYYDSYRLAAFYLAYLDSKLE